MTQPTTPDRNTRREWEATCLSAVGWTAIGGGLSGFFCLGLLSNVFFIFSIPGGMFLGMILAIPGGPVLTSVLARLASPPRDIRR